MKMEKEEPVYYKGPDEGRGRIVPPEEINAAHAEYWKHVNEKLSRLRANPPNALTHPEEARWYLEQCEAMFATPEQGWAKLAALREEIDAGEQRDEITMHIGYQHGYSRNQTKNAQNDRPAARSEIKRRILEAMRYFVRGNEDRTLNDFMDAARNGSIDGLVMTAPYVVTLDDDEEMSKKYKFRGLRDLWTESRKTALP